jgi:short-subunit dehydrogenase
VEERLFSINYHAPQRIIKALAPRLAPGGRLVVVGSLAAYVPTPLRSTYSAAKAAIGAYLESLSVELRTRGVMVTHVLPGFVRTDISRVALRGDGSSHGEMDANQAGGMSPEKCSRQILKSVARRRRRVFVALGVRGRVGLFLSRWFPGLLQRLLSRGVSP